MISEVKTNFFDVINKYLGIVLDADKMLIVKPKGNSYELGVKILTVSSIEQKNSEKALVRNIIQRLKEKQKDRNESDKSLDARAEFVFKKALENIMKDSNDTEEIQKKRILLANALKSYIQDNRIFQRPCKTSEAKKDIIHYLDDSALEACRYYWVLFHSQHLTDKQIKKEEIFRYLIAKLDVETIALLEEHYFPHPCMKLLIQEQMKRVLYNEALIFSCTADISRHLSHVSLLAQNELKLCYPESLIENDPEQFKENCAFFHKLLTAFLIQCSDVNANQIKIITEWNTEVENVEKQEVITNDSFSEVCKRFLKGLSESNKNEKDILRVLKMKLFKLLLALTQESYVLPSKAVLLALPSLQLKSKKNHQIQYIFGNDGVVVQSQVTLFCSMPKFEIVIKNSMKSKLDHMPHWSCDLELDLIRPEKIDKELKTIIIKPLRALGFTISFQ